MNKLIKTNAYATLVTDIAEIYNRARKRLIESYWQIGRRIVEHEQQGDGKAEYGVRLLEHLSEDLQHKLGRGFSISNLWFFLPSAKSAQSVVNCPLCFLGGPQCPLW